MKKFLLILSFIVFIVQAQAQSLPASGSKNTALVRLYPNPATTVVNFDLQNNVKGYSIQIFSFMGGKKMFEQKLTTDHTAVNLSSFTRGVYIFQLRNEEGRIVESGKFQVSR